MKYMLVLHKDKTIDKYKIRLTNKIYCTLDRKTMSYNISPKLI
jgi:hypothetical protein